ncbi:protein kinase domain-containing protein [Nonomuraea sp. NBC_00507]|uniref:protein kinase domain-containing protein n=1 Tax=Nonomuraea sp. NBC_00507 TaxID=2976002 RepID=UPI003FA5ED82
MHRLGTGVATAMAAIHGVVHRDLKMDNVLLRPDGPRVIDFGIAHYWTAPRLPHRAGRHSGLHVA